MTDDRDERNLQRAAMALRAPGARDEDALNDVIEALRRETAEGDTGQHVASRGRRVEGRGRARRRPLVDRGTIRFVAGLAAGIAFAVGLGLGLFAGWRMRAESYRIAAETATGRVGPTGVEATSLPSTHRPVQFMLVAPAATRVALVGEFNDWDPAATPMARAPGGAWHVALPLANGRHVYAFLVDGTSWVADPQAPLVPEGWFGARNSVLLVSGQNREQRQ
jgi:hypothetical protein